MAVSLAALVPIDHFSRHLEAKLDLGFVRGWVRDRYAEGGRPGIDPAIFFELQPIVFVESVRSERKSLETAGLQLSHRCYLGYALAEPLPDHPSRTRNRRPGVAVFE